MYHYGVAKSKGKASSIYKMLLKIVLILTSPIWFIPFCILAGVLLPLIGVSLKISRIIEKLLKM